MRYRSSGAVIGGLVNDTNYKVNVDDADTLELVNSHVVNASFVNNGANDRITRALGTWTDDGYFAGQKLYVSGTALNDDTYTIASISGDGKTLFVGDAGLADEGPLNATFDGVIALNPIKPVSVSVTFAKHDAGDTITRGAGSWLADGFADGESFTITGDGANNGSYTIESITASTITLTRKNFVTEGAITKTFTLAASGRHRPDQGRRSAHDGGGRGQHGRQNFLRRIDRSRRSHEYFPA